jgi:hypothetical protein
MPKVETDTNQVYRKKYFINSEKVLFAARDGAAARTSSVSQVIDASKVVLSKNAVPVRCQTGEESGRIKVEVVREGNRVKGMRIDCPCGRHAELDVEYSPTAVNP